MRVGKCSITGMIIDFDYCKECNLKDRIEAIIEKNLKIKKNLACMIEEVKIDRTEMVIQNEGRLEVARAKVNSLHNR